MIYLHLTLIFLAVFVLGLVVRLPMKRIIFLRSVKKICEKKGYGFEVRRAISSMFTRGDEPDLVITKDGTEYRIFILTTRFKRARYHFETPESFTVYKRHLTFGGRKNDRITVFNSYDIYEVKRCERDNFDIKEDGNAVNILLPFPMPNEVTFVKKNQIFRPWDGDKVYGNVLFYSGKGLRDMLNK